MIAIDTNLLVYSHRSDSPFHKQTISALRPVLEGQHIWGLPWPCVHEFFSVVTNRRIFPLPTPPADAFAFLQSLMSSPRFQFLSESDGYFEKLRSITINSGISGPRIHDARIAALCLHHGVTELLSADRDFSFFPQLKTRNPLVTRS